MSKEPNPLFVFCEDLSSSKKNLLTEENQSKYDCFIVNRYFSFERDTIHAAEMLNRYPALPKRLQYDFYLHSLRKRKRYIQWVKKDAPDEKIETIKRYFNYNTFRAREIVDLISNEDLNAMRLANDRGGVKK